MALAALNHAPIGTTSPTVLRDWRAIARDELRRAGACGLSSQSLNLDVNTQQRRVYAAVGWARTVFLSAVKGVVELTSSVFPEVGMWP